MNMKNLNSFGYDEPDDDEHDHNAAASVADDHDRHHEHNGTWTIYEKLDDSQDETAGNTMKHDGHQLIDFGYRLHSQVNEAPAGSIVACAISSMEGSELGNSVAYPKCSIWAPAKTSNN